MRRAAELTPTSSKSHKTFAAPAPSAAAAATANTGTTVVPALPPPPPPAAPPRNNAAAASIFKTTTGSGMSNAMSHPTSHHQQQQAPPPPPHTSSTQIPTLSSAPPSFGLSIQASYSQDSQISSASSDDVYFDADDATLNTEGLVETTTFPPPPPPPAAAATRTSLVVPPLPPPPKGVVTTSSATSSPSSRSAGTSPIHGMAKSSPPRNKPLLPTMAPLPPPPIMTTGTKKTSTTTTSMSPPIRTTASTESASSQTSSSTPVRRPPPPPPVKTSSTPPPPAPAVSPEQQPQQQAPPPPPTIVRSKPSRPPPLPRTAFLNQQQQLSVSGISSKGGGGSATATATGAAGTGNGGNVSLLARRQTHFSVAVVATESAHHLAWKNGLQLPDLLNGLVQNIATVAGGGGGNNNNKGSSGGAAQPLPPFRSVTRALTLNWSDMLVHFYDANEHDLDDNNDTAAGLEEESKEDQSKTAAAAAATIAGGQKMNPHDAPGVAAELQRSAALQEVDGNLQYELDLLEDQVDNLLQDANANNKSENSTTSSSSSAGASSSLDDSRGHFRGSHSHDTHHDNHSGDGGGHHHHSYDLEARQRQFEQVAKDAFSLTSPPNIPWLWRYRQALDASTDGLEHDMLACPNVVLLVCTTQEEASTPPLEALRALQSPHYLPPNFHNGLWNPNSVPNNSSSTTPSASTTTTAGGVRHEVLVLHDVLEGPKNWNEAQFVHTLRQSFGPSANVLRINSIPPETAVLLSKEEKSDWWGRQGQAGNCLSLSDRVLLRKWLSTFISNGLLPAMERRITDLNIIVSDRKKGVKNVLKSFWRGTATTPTSSASPSSRQNNDDDYGGGVGGSGDHQSTGFGVGGSRVQVKYRYDTIESQTRLLADSLFLMRDYDGALGTYRLIKDDYKQDKAMAHYGSCQEMMALCMHLLDPYGKSREVFNNIENALLSYSKASDRERALMNQRGEQPQPTSGRPTASVPCTRLATRLCLVLSSSRQICSGRHLEVADLLASASSNETSLGAAVLLEQSSAHYYKAEMYRKYAFHMLMSGHMFRSAGQEEHAFRCFTSALYLYRDSQWDELHNHLRSALAAQLYSTGRMSLSLQLYAKLVGSSAGGRVSTKSQQKFVHHLLEICNGHNKKALAGADRMAAPSRLTGAARDRYRQERLDRIVQVVQFTKCASRVLELPNIDLPYILDSTVVVLGEEEATEAGIAAATSSADAQTGALLQHQPMIGVSCRGDEEVWDQLTLETIGELRAFNNAKNQQQQNDELVTKVLAQIEDREIRSVIAEIDKEKANRNLLERSKRSANYKATPPVRALMEPLTVEFSMSNLLGIPIDMVDMQLVASMTDADDSRRLCTNEDAIKIKSLVTSNEERKWTFHSSAMEFCIADFCRVSSDSSSPTSNQRWKAAGEDIDPFFVVTKSSVSLEPESKMTVALSICPLIEGDLQILGVRSRLFDDVWVFHPFDVKGELLQNTRANRANRVRGESLILKAKVEKGMPCLTAELAMPPSLIPQDSSSAAVGPVLQGQISKWNLRLSNVGTAPAKHITLKTNLPWVNLWKGVSEGDSKASDLEKESTSFAVGPSGTLLNIPIDGLGLKVDGTIQPGESVDIAVDIRSSGAGKQDFYLLFRYELAGDEAESTSRHRWLRRMFQVPVYPSLTLGAAIIPSFSKQAEHILSVELTNYRTDRPDKLHLMLESLNLASRAYKLEPLHGKLTGGTTSSSTALRLGWQERVTLHYRIVPLDEPKSTCLLSQCDLSSIGEETTSSSEASSSSLLDFLCLERANNQFRETLVAHQMALARAAAAQHHEENQPRSISQIRRANTSALSEKESGSFSSDWDDKGHATSIRRLAPFEGSLESVVLLCSWENEDGSLKGEHHIRDLAVRPAVESPTSRECPITITGNHPTSVKNNFEDGPANVAFEVTLRNRLTRAPVDFEFALDQPENFDLSGPECFKWELGAGEEIKVPLQALIPFVGTFNLQKVRLTTIDNDNGPVSYQFPLQWMVSVEQAASVE